MKNNPDHDSVAVSSREAVQRFYDAGSPYYFQLFGEHIHDGYYITGRESQPEAQENLVRFLAEKAGIGRGAKILDVGCGVGGSSIWLAKNLAAQTVGITISPVQLDIATKLAREQEAKSTFLLMNAEQMDFPEPFDFIWVVAALTHFHHQENFLKSAAGLLKNQGKIIIYDWTLAEDAISKDRDVKLVLEGMVLANMYTAADYARWLARAGCRIEYPDDITAQTIRTWEFPLYLMKDPAIWGAAYRVAQKEGKEIFHFLKCLRAMKRAMQRRKILSTVIIAEKTRPP